MKKDLLVCIAFHYSKERIKYLQDIIHCLYSEYKCSFDIIIDTNINKFDLLSDFRTNLNICEHANLSHPFHLTWKHRQHINENIDKYENFMYIENDMLVPYENYLTYLENFKLLWPLSVPSFVRIEEYEGSEFITDAVQSQHLDIVNIGDKQFTKMNNPYHAFWIMPAKELKETMIRDFDRLSESRETAASYPMWELNKTPLVEIENGLISEKCYSYHLPNNYAQSKESKFAKIKPENIFIK